MGYDQFGFSVAVALRYIDPTRKQDKGAYSDCACGKDIRAWRVGSALPKPSDAADLGKHRFAVGSGVQLTVTLAERVQSAMACCLAGGNAAV